MIDPARSLFLNLLRHAEIGGDSLIETADLDVMDGLVIDMTGADHRVAARTPWSLTWWDVSPLEA